MLNQQQNFFLHCTHFPNQRLTLINKIKDTDKRIFDKNDSLLTQTLLSGDEKLTTTHKKSILGATIQFLISSERFETKYSRVDQVKFVEDSL